MPESFSYHFAIAKSRIHHGFLLAGVLALIGLFALFVDDGSISGGPLLGVLNLCLAGGIAFYVWRLSKDTAARLIIDGHGVWFRDWGLPPVPWSNIADTEHSGGRLQAFLSIRLRDQTRFLAELTEEERRKAEGNRLVRPPLLKIPAHSVEADFQILQAAIEEGLARQA